MHRREKRAGKDFTPNLGDNAIAVHEISMARPCLQLYYLGLEADKKLYDYADAKVKSVLAKGWLEEKWSHPTIKPQKTCPPLDEAIIKNVRGGEAAMGNIAQVDWRVCTYAAGKLNIMETHTAGLATSSPAVRERFYALEAEHVSKYMNMLVTHTSAPAPTVPDPETAETSPQDPSDPTDAELTEFENEEAAATASGGFRARSTSAVQGVTVLIGKDEKIYLLSQSADITLNKWTQVGGIGGGSFSPKNADIDEHRTPYHFPDGVGALRMTVQART